MQPADCPVPAKADPGAPKPGDFAVAAKAAAPGTAPRPRTTPRRRGPARELEPSAFRNGKGLNWATGRPAASAAGTPSDDFTAFLDVSGELAAFLGLACRTVGEGSAVEVDLDFAAFEVAADELLGKRVLDVPLDGAPERPRAVRAVLARLFDDPVDHVGRQRELDLAIDEV